MADCRSPVIDLIGRALLNFVGIDLKLPSHLQEEKMKECCQIRNRRDAFTLVELLVVIAIIGVMVGLLLPAVQAAREAARRMTCSNNMKQIGLGVQMYHDAFRCIPPLSFTLQSSTLTNRPASWIVRILPFIEQNAAFEQTRFDITDFSNRSGTNHSWRAYHGLNVTTLNCPSSPLPIFRRDTATASTVALGAPTQLDIQISSYVGISGQYNAPVNPASFWNGNTGMHDYSGVMVSVDSRNTRPLTFASVLDGTSNTFTVGEQANFKTVIDTAGARTTFDDRSSNYNGGAWSGGGGVDPADDVLAGQPFTGTATVRISRHCGHQQVSTLHLSHPPSIVLLPTE